MFNLVASLLSFIHRNDANQNIPKLNAYTKRVNITHTEQLTSICMSFPVAFVLQDDN